MQTTISPSQGWPRAGGPRARRDRIAVAAWSLAAALSVGVPSQAAGPSPCSVRHPSDARVAWECRRLAKGETLEGLFGDRWIDVARFNRIDRRHATPGVSIKVPVDLAAVAQFSPMSVEYEAGREYDKLIVVDVSEQFLGAYERGRLVLSTPATTGRPGHLTPTGEFRITALDRRHSSSLYTMEGRSTPYPMHYGLRFFTTPGGVAYWIHGRDVPGHPGSHGCIGLYDEGMQSRYYGNPRAPVLTDAERLYDWVRGDRLDPGRLFEFEGPPVVITGEMPEWNRP